VTNYIHNLIQFLLGFTRLHLVKYKPKWSPWKFLPVYIFDYGTHVLTGGAVVSWSRWFYDHRQTNRVAAFINRLLGHAQKNHGQLSGPPLWGTVDCSFVVRCSLCAGWAFLIIWSLL